LKKYVGNKRSNLFIVLLMFGLFHTSVVLGQEIQNSAVTITVESNCVAKQENVSKNTSSNVIHFVRWFMGSKQDPNNAILTGERITKKQIMTSGMVPNRLLIKVFLKKVVNLESSIA
jgi:stalled ribosome rescue protein Dom34